MTDTAGMDLDANVPAARLGYLDIGYFELLIRRWDAGDLHRGHTGDSTPAGVWDVPPTQNSAVETAARIHRERTVSIREVRRRAIRPATADAADGGFMGTSVTRETSVAITLAYKVFLLVELGV